MMKKLMIAVVAGVLVAMAAGAATAGALRGKETTVATVRANFTDTWRVTFVGGEEAVVAIVGDGDTDLDLYVYDDNGHLITFSEGRTDRERVSFRPIFTGQFAIKVVNRSRVMSNRYAIAWN